MVPPPIDADRADGPDLLLFARATATDVLYGRWEFALETYDGETLLVGEGEDKGDLNRLTLWAIVRGLEAIDGPSQVTLLSGNQYAIRSMTESLPRWRAGDYVWEHFGRSIEIQNADLWRRIDHTLSIHAVDACLVQPRRVSGTNSSSSAEFPSTSADEPIFRVDGAHEPTTDPRKQKSRVKPADASEDGRTQWSGSASFRSLLTAPNFARRGRRFTLADLSETGES